MAILDEQILAERLTDETAPATDRVTNGVTRRRFTVDEYYRMAEAGILNEDDRVELIEGEILQLCAIGSRHAAGVTRLNRILSRRYSDRFLISVQNPVRLSDDTEPEPDLVLLKMRDDDYNNAHPRPEDVLIIIEVSDSTLIHDRDVKMRLYAEAGIPEAWLVDLNSDRFDVYSDPMDGLYRKIRRYPKGSTVVSETLPEVSTDVDDILR